MLICSGKHLDVFLFFVQKNRGYSGACFLCVFGLIGSQNKSLGITAKNHNDHYTVDESVLKRGAAMYAQFAYDFLEEKS
jgi:metal-dependent amidase/aminoacylase/carboxypeptidase family protein